MELLQIFQELGLVEKSPVLAMLVITYWVINKVIEKNIIIPFNKLLQDLRDIKKRLDEIKQQINTVATQVRHDHEIMGLKLDKDKD